MTFWIQAQTSAQTVPSAANDSLWSIITSGGWPGVFILLVLITLSVVAVYLVIDQILSLRRSDMLPTGLSGEVAAMLRDGQIADAGKVLRDRPSLLSGLILAGIQVREFGWPEIEKTVQDALAERSAAMHRRIDYLSMVANLSPMVGLLGTVTGMIIAFRQVAATSGAAGAGDLAEGIYQALVTTVGGLIVAIPALAAAGVLRSRVDELLAEVTHHAQVALAPLRRRLVLSSDPTGTSYSPAKTKRTGQRMGSVPPAQLRGTSMNPPPPGTAPAVPGE